MAAPAARKSNDDDDETSRTGIVDGECRPTAVEQKRERERERETTPFDKESGNDTYIPLFQAEQRRRRRRVRGSDRHSKTQ
jgi:hypothetical protein